MAKLVLADVSNLLGNPTSAANTINSNSDLIVAALEKTLSRDGTLPNQMQADLDMNNNDILNVDTIDVDNLIVAGQNLTDFIDDAIEEISGYVDQAEAIRDQTAGLRDETQALRDQANVYAGSAASSAASANNSALTAQDLVEAAVSGFIGFQEGMGYDFGYIIDTTTYFDQNWGTIV